MASAAVATSTWQPGLFGSRAAAPMALESVARKTQADVRYVMGHCRPGTPARLLDVPCGSGRHTLELARHGHEVTGIDLSIDAIEEARAAAISEGLPARFMLADMRELPVLEPFDGVVCLGNSASYFGARDTQVFFNMMAAALRPHGWLVLDSHTCAESVFPLEKERDIEIDGMSYRAALSYDPRTSILRTAGRLTIDGDERPVTEAHRVMTVGELVRSLAAAGLRVTGLHADPDGTPFTPGARRLLLHAVRAY